MNRFLAALVGCVLLVGFIVGCNKHESFEPVSKNSKDNSNPLIILRQSEDILKPFIWFYSELDNTEAGFQKLLNYGDPNRITMLLFQDWFAKHDANAMASRIDKIINTWRLEEPGGHLNYTFAYGRLPAGWRSGMDSWSFPLFLVGLWQETGQEGYKALALKLIEYTERDVQKGGTVWRNSKGCWFSEYAWDGMAEGDEFYVLNGHLYALQSVKMLADALQDSSLEKLYRCGVRATKAYSKRFFVEDKWVSYMLTPKTINQTHYVIFEIMLFDALYALDQDPFFSKEAERRRELLRRHFPVYLHRENGQNHLTLSTVGAPHPYSIDTYPLIIECDDGGQKRTTYSITHPTNTRMPVAERAFLSAVTELDSDKITCRVDAAYSGKRVRLYTSPVTNLDDNSLSINDQAFALKADYDAQMMDDAVLVDPARRVTPPSSPETYRDTQGRIFLKPNSSVPWKADQLMGIEFDADDELAIGVGITSDGKDFFRYYPKTKRGAKNLILLSPLGFDNGEQITSIDHVTLFVYTDKQKQPVKIQPKRLMFFDNHVALYRYFSTVDPNFYTE